MTNLRKSYSLSLPVKLCQDIKYFKKTTPHQLNDIMETFILDFIRNNTDNIIPTKKGRPSSVISPLNKYTTISISLKHSTIKKIRTYKADNFNLDKAIEEHLKLIIPVREIR